MRARNRLMTTRHSYPQALASIHTFSRSALQLTQPERVQPNTSKNRAGRCASLSLQSNLNCCRRRSTSEVNGVVLPLGRSAGKLVTFREDNSCVGINDHDDG